MTLLDSGNLRDLTTAGMPEEIARQLLAGRAYARMQTKLAALRKRTAAQAEYWKGSANWYSSKNKDQRHAFAEIQNEYAEALRGVFGEDASSLAGTDPRYAALPPAKRDILRRIDQDYGEMQAEIYSEMAGLALPIDQERLKLLEVEKQRDILAALTPEEAETFNLRASQTASMIQNQYGDGIKTEADYRKIFALQKAFEDRYSFQTFFTGGNISQEKLQERTNAERQMLSDMRSAVGDEAYATLRRSSDPDFKMLSGLEKRFQLPEGTAQALYDSRDLYASQSRAIVENPNLTPENRARQLRELGQQITQSLQSTLGQQGAELYARQSNWVNMLKSGQAFSLDPKDAQPGMMLQNSSVYPLQPKPTAPAPAKH